MVAGSLVQRLPLVKSLDQWKTMPWCFLRVWILQGFKILRHPWRQFVNGGLPFNLFTVLFVCKQRRELTGDSDDG